VALVNSTVFVYRIIRNDDYVVRIPNCYYSITALGWRCFTQEIINRYIVVPSSPLFFYLQNYRYSYYYTVPVIQSVKYFLAVRKSHPASGRKAGRVQPKKSKIIHSKPRPQLKHREEKKFKPIKQREIKRIRQHRQVKQRRAMPNRTHRKGPFSRKDDKLKKLKVKHIPQKPHHELPKPVHEERKQSQNSETKALPKVDQSEKSSPAAKPKTTQKFVTDNKPTLVNLPKLHITPQSAKTYYYANVYYTQPLGFLYYYPAGFASFQYCTYVNFVSQCETRIALPATFTIGPHLTYYDVSFETCSNDR
jgi:hypothetical protein